MPDFGKHFYVRAVYVVALLLLPAALLAQGESGAEWMYEAGKINVVFVVVAVMLLALLLYLLMMDRRLRKLENEEKLSK